MDRRIRTRHPQKGKQGVNIERAKYDVVRDAILKSLGANKELTFADLNRAVGRQLKGKFEGSISWYVVSVKLDLEARGLIERIPGASPQRLRMVK